MPLPEPATKKRRLSDGDVKVGNQYQGYTFPREGSNHPSLDRVDAQKTSPMKFFERYISQRRPCIIVNLQERIEASLETLLKTAGDAVVQVERRPDVTHAFGQNRTTELQESLTVQELVNRLNDSTLREMYYMSTQERANPFEIFSVPCRELLQGGFIPPTIAMAGHLILQTCNLWVGGAAESTSGLHHDFHDNFYVLLSGKKTFRLYSPADAHHMNVFGSIELIHPNGLISYANRPTRSDGYPSDDAPLHASYHSENESFSDDESEVVLGRGYDYHSDSDLDEKRKPEEDDFERYVETKEATSDPLVHQIGTDTLNPDQMKRPDHFSMIDPTRSGVSDRFPSFASCRECLVQLTQGECLYLPASWFHCVTSHRDDNKSSHMALNYWYHPPDQLDCFSNPYRHDDWTRLMNVR